MRCFTHETFESPDEDGACCQLRETDLGELCDADEARETAGELEMLRANFKALDLDEPMAAQAQLKEATALLEETAADGPLNNTGERHLRILAFLASRAPAQPAAPTPVCPHCASPDGHCPWHKPAAPEPSANHVRLAAYWEKRAESAESQIAAARKCFAKLPSPDQLRADKRLTLDQKHELAVLVTALLTAPSPGAGEETL